MHIYIPSYQVYRNIFTLVNVPCSYAGDILLLDLISHDHFMGTVCSRVYLRLNHSTKNTIQLVKRPWIPTMCYFGPVIA